MAEIWTNSEQNLPYERLVLRARVSTTPTGPGSHTGTTPERQTPLSRLPVELLTKIARYSPQAEKSRLCLTNRHLRVITTRELYRNIHLAQMRPYSIFELQAMLKRVYRLCVSLSGNSVNRAFVETLEIDGLR